MPSHKTSLTKTAGRRILCVGGGTLGSVTPLLAVVEEIRSRFSEVEVEWWGTDNGPEKRLVESHHLIFKTISAGKFRRYASMVNVWDLGRIVLGFVGALWRFGFSKPACLLTAGSYVAVPVGWAAYLYGIPIFAHQQDVRPGLANRLLAPVAKKITVVLADSIKDFPAGKTVWTGNPVRAIFTNPPSAADARQRLDLDPAKPTILIIGGGTGAQALNEVVFAARTELVKLGQVIHLTGAHKETASALPGYLTAASTTESVTFMSAADVVITRAGMGGLSELAALKKAAVVVPIPQSHQEDNAKYFADRGGVILLPQSALTPQKLLALARQLISDATERQRLGSRLHELLPTRAAQRMADLVLAYINQPVYVSS